METKPRMIYYRTVSKYVEMIFDDRIVKIKVNNKLLAEFQIENVWDCLVQHLQELDPGDSPALNRRKYEATHVNESTHAYLQTGFANVQE